MQSSLKALFGGKREVVELPPKIGPGRPRKVREVEKYAVLEAVQSQPARHEACCVGAGMGRKFNSWGPGPVVVAEALGTNVWELENTWRS